MRKNRAWLVLMCLTITLFSLLIGCSNSTTSSLGESEPANLGEQKSSVIENNHSLTEHTPEESVVEEENQEESVSAKDEVSLKDTEEIHIAEEEQATPIASESPLPADQTASAPSPQATEADKISPQSRKASSSTVSLAIIGPHGEDYIMLEETAVDWQEGDTVLDVLKQVTRQEKIQLEYQGRNKSAYIEGIDHLYEFDRGPLSGWVYRVNGIFPNSSAGAWTVEQGDFIEWLYTLDLGKDVGGNNQSVGGQ